MRALSPLVIVGLATLLACTASSGVPGQIYSVFVKVERDEHGFVDELTVYEIRLAPQMRPSRITIPESVLARKRAELRASWPADAERKTRYTYFFYDPAHPDRDPEY